MSPAQPWAESLWSWLEFKRTENTTSCPTLSQKRLETFPDFSAGPRRRLDRVLKVSTRFSLKSSDPVSRALKPCGVLRCRSLQRRETLLSVVRSRTWWKRSIFERQMDRSASGPQTCWWTRRVSVQNRMLGPVWAGSSSDFIVKMSVELRQRSDPGSVFTGFILSFLCWTFLVKVKISCFKSNTSSLVGWRQVPGPVLFLNATKPERRSAPAPKLRSSEKRRKEKNNLKFVSFV